jgi:hypothetical protein
MCRTVGGVLVLLLALPAWADDKPKDKPMTPKEQYQALLREQQDAMKAFSDAYRKAKDDVERNKIFEEKYPKPEKLTPKFLELAEKNPKDAVAVDALTWVVTNVYSGGQPVTKALELLLRDHVSNERIGQVCQNLPGSTDAQALLRGILEKNPHKEAQAEACLALIQQPAEPDAEREKLIKEFADHHAAQMKPERLTSACYRLGYIGNSKASEGLLRTLLEKDARREVQGAACLSLGRALKRESQLQPPQGKDADRLRKESEQLLERAADKYADVRVSPNSPPVGDQATGELFEMRHLVIGKEVPEVEGEDADGKKFKLSDYRGKVVLIDFWGNW